jgi:hypothetical protein
MPYWAVVIVPYADEYMSFLQGVCVLYYTGTERLLLEVE